MPLWYHAQENGWTRSTFARESLGADVYLCCPGPSLAAVADAELHGPGTFVLAVNTAYPHVRPDVWVGMDGPASYDPRLWWEPFIKIARRSHAEAVCGGEYIKRCPLTYFADVERASPLDLFARRGHDASFVWQANTFFVALHAAVWMGAKRVYLVGNDLGGREGRDYHDERTLRGEQRSRNARLYDWIARQLPAVARVGSEYGVSLVSCTPDSPVNEAIGYVPLAEALGESERRVPAPAVRRPLYCVDATLTAWRTDEPLAEAGVVVGVAPSQAWMLPWWWDQFARHNPRVPVAFADFGLGAAERAWCAERGTLIDLVDVPATGWFRKPLAILRAPFQRILWLDLDTEVRGAVAPLFACAERPLAIAARPSTLEGSCAHEHRYGWFTMLPPEARAWCTGILVTAHGNPLVCEWAQIALADEADYRGDNEMLAVLAHCRPGAVVEIDPALASSTFRDCTDAVVVHWRGPVGKQRIRERMAAGS